MSEHDGDVYNALGQAVCLRCGDVLDWAWDGLCPRCKERIHSLVADFMDGLDPAERKYIDDATDGIAV